MRIRRIPKENKKCHCRLTALFLSIILLGGAISNCGERSDLAIRFRAEKLLSKADRYQERLAINNNISDDDFKNLVGSYEAVINLVGLPVDGSAVDKSSDQQKQAWATALLANTRIALLYFNRNEFDKAFEYYEKVAISPVSDDVQKNVVLRYMALTKEKAGNFGSAAAIYDSTAKGYLSLADPRKPDMDALAAPIKAAEMHLRQGDRPMFDKSLEKARSYFNSLIDKYPDSRLENAALGKIAATYLRQNRYKKALGILESAGKDDQGRLSPVTLMFIADIYMENLKDYDGAEKTYREFLETYPQGYNGGRAVLGLGICLYEKGEYVKTRKTLKGIEKISDVTEEVVAQAFFLVALCYEAENNWSRASGELDLIMATFPGRKESYDAALQKVNYFREKGLDEMTAKSFEAAVKYIEKYIDVNSAKPAAVAQAIGYLTKAYIENGEYENAIEKLSILHSRYPRTPDGVLASLKIADLYENALYDSLSAVEWLNIYLSETPFSVDKEAITRHIEELQKNFPHD